jgi:glyoxylase-like metal-dependent hydrolase (beta-lactamase superfamily II)
MAFWKEELMEIHKIGCRATAFTFNKIESFLTNVFLIKGKSKVFLIDTFCGSDSMTPILNALKEYVHKEVIVINTHFHWDHVWGNSSFCNHTIISHERCRALLDSGWETQLNKNRKYVMGNAEKVLPNFTFTEKMIFHEDGIELFHSPGHTEDSISVFDHHERILYAGDNLEKPLVYVENADITAYIATLENYLAYKPSTILAGHTLQLTVEDIESTIEYLKGLSEGKKIDFESEYERETHARNLKTINKA